MLATVYARSEAPRKSPSVNAYWKDTSRRVVRVELLDQLDCRLVNLCKYHAVELSEAMSSLCLG